MRFYPTKIHLAFLCFIFVSITLNLGCSKDSDLLADTVISESESSVLVEQQVENSTTSEVDEQENQAESNSVEIRTTSFSPLHDAHVQSGRGYNQNIIRLEEGNRTSYLMFDLGRIAEISGTIKEAFLQFTIDSDDGSGTVNVYRGESSEWTESTLSDESAPEAVVQIGSIAKAFNIGETQVIELDVQNISADVKTLILQHENGNDFAFASKEHVSKIGPKLVVSYEVSESAAEISDDEITASENQNNTTNNNSENTEPIAIADASPSSGGVPLEVSFQGENSSDDKKVVSYLWNFKDGATSNEPNPTHTFDQIGEYQVELSVTDEEGLVNTDFVTITVNSEQNEGPKAVATASPLSGEVPLEVNFVGSQSTDDNGIASYSWDFKDGSKTNVADFTYTYTKVGTYQAELTVTDENGLTDIQTVTIEVKESSNNKPNAVASSNLTSGPAPLNVQFTGDKSTDDKGIYSYAWNFKDGSAIQYVANPSHTFNQAGSYEVELIVTDTDGAEDKETIVIEVTANQNTAPNAVASANVTSGEAPLTVQFSGDSSTDDTGITSYFWNFMDGSTASNANPSHTFNSPGNYTVGLTVKDAQGQSSTTSIIISVTAANNNTSGNAPPGYYVATNGSSGNNGLSPSSPWSLSHAFNIARAGDIIYVKAGNYGNLQLRTNNAGAPGNPIKFIGYTNTPGDVVSSNGSTFNNGENLNAGKMPLLQAYNAQGTAITLHDSNIHVENFQITGYGFGVQTITRATNTTLKNIIVTNVGNQSSASSYTGVGFKIQSNNALLENCFVLNAGAEAFNLSDSDYSRVNNCKVYATNNANPTDYYFLLTGGTNNTVVENSYAERASYLSHGGHGFDMKDLATNNTFRNCTAKRTNFELNFSGVRYNTIVDCAIYGVNTSSGNWHSVMAIFNGANNNLIKNMYIQDTWAAISWGDYDDGFVGPGGDRDEVSLGYDNTFDGIVIKNTDRVLNIGGGNQFTAAAKRNKLINCRVDNFEFVAVTHYLTEDIVIQNCSFSNGRNLVAEGINQYAPYSKFNVSWINNTWSNVSFTPPN
jgi:PKD repeat protein